MTLKEQLEDELIDLQAKIANIIDNDGYEEPTIVLDGQLKLNI